MTQGYTQDYPLDTDPSLSGNSDYVVPSQKAVKTYVDNKVTGTVSSSSIPSTDNSVATYDGVSGRIIQKSRVSISDNGTIVQNMAAGNNIAICSYSGFYVSGTSNILIEPAESSPSFAQNVIIGGVPAGNMDTIIGRGAGQGAAKSDNEETKNTIIGHNAQPTSTYIKNSIIIGADADSTYLSSSIDMADGVIVIGAGATSENNHETVIGTTGTTRTYLRGNVDVDAGKTYNINGSPHTHSGSVAESWISLYDVSTWNVTTGSHGFAPKAPGDATKFLDGTANWDTIKDSDLLLSDITANNVTTGSHGFIPKATSDTNAFFRGDASWSPVTTASAFTPTYTGIANVDSASHVLAYYYRIGNVVNVWGAASINPTNNATLTKVRLTLPVTSNLTAVAQLIGQCNGRDIDEPGGVYGDATNDEAVISFTSASTAAHTVDFSFVYIVL